MTSLEKYWDATEIARHGFRALLKLNFAPNTYIITNDGYEVNRFYETSNEQAICIFNK